jgi:cobalt-zinc-cadmium efflux system protein
MSHSHDHHHQGHSHAPAGAAIGTRLAFGMVLNLAFVAVEVGFGVLAHSMALLADAGHNLGDVLGLGVAWGATRLAQRRPSHRYTYGMRSSSILAALLNAIVPLIAVGAIVVEAIRRLAMPVPVDAATVMIVAAIGILVNGLSALLLLRGDQGDLNIKSAVAHMLADAGVSAGVVLSGAIVLATGWLRIDPAVSLLVSVVIIAGTWRLLRQSLDLALQAVPAGIDPQAVSGFLMQVQGVCALHDLHIWPMSTTETALTCHLVMPDGSPGDAALERLAHDLHDRFGIEHATIQVETGDPAHPCRLTPDHVV